MQYTSQFIADKLKSDDRWLYRGICAIYGQQTSTEQSCEQTIEHNKRGFGASDAQILSSFAKQILDHDVKTSRYPWPLSFNQRAIARKLMIKYAGQLARLANKSVNERTLARETKTQEPALVSA
jgi:hypothetical protein